MLRVGLITTLDTNIGDELIRQGIIAVLRQSFDADTFDFRMVNKHDPMTVYPPSHPARWSRLLPAGRSTAAAMTSRVISGFSKSLFHDCDLVVQCGAPVLWPDCRRNEWAQPLWYGILRRLHHDTPVLNLAAGSCYPWENHPSSLQDSPDRTYVQDIGRYCRLTTARDDLTRTLFASVGVDAAALPCAAFLAGESTHPPAADSPLLVNYMSGAGHYSWGQQIDQGRWRTTFVDVIRRLERRHNVVFVCHSKAEEAMAASMFPDSKRVFPKRAEEYFKIVLAGKAALSNRLHMAVAMAGVGVPAVTVGTDTRLLMLTTLGLPTFYAKDASAVELETAVEDLLTRRSSEGDRLRDLRERTTQSYVEAVQTAMTKLSASS